MAIINIHSHLIKEPMQLKVGDMVDENELLTFVRDQLQSVSSNELPNERSMHLLHRETNHVLGHHHHLENLKNGDSYNLLFSLPIGSAAKSEQEATMCIYFLFEKGRLPVPAEVIPNESFEILLTDLIRKLAYLTGKAEATEVSVFDLVIENLRNNDQVSSIMASPCESGILEFDTLFVHR